MWPLKQSQPQTDKRHKIVSGWSSKWRKKLRRFCFFEEVLYFLPNALPEPLLSLWDVKAVDWGCAGPAAITSQSDLRSVLNSASWFVGRMVDLSVLVFHNEFPLAYGFLILMGMLILRLRGENKRLEYKKQAPLPSLVLESLRLLF